ncbi:MAG TPA: DUF1015 domain-containing protein [Terriglobales bacterium]|jgi:uncharacterized protein (DUF1015 family)|nr:DUF1015 domain-containing protein [Terriglobales bacterium]
MALISAFPALRYDREKVRLADVVTQPYDKITPQMQDRYYQASPYNLVRIILGRPEGEETERNNRYTEAAECLKNWRKAGVFAQDSPSMYAYSQRFLVPGTSETVERRGFIAAGTLYDYAEKVVFRHEQTLAKPKSDRLNLLRATHAHFGQIFMLYSDPAQTIDSLLFEDGNHEWQEVTDEYKVLHRLRRIGDPATLNIVKTEMADRKLIIADGHHRYETALNFRKEAANTSNTCLRNNANRVMMTFVNMDSPGLVILPTHRVVFGLPNFDVSSFAKKARELCEVRELGALDSARAVSALAESGKNVISFVAVTKQGSFLLTAKTGSEIQIPGDFSARQRKLDVVNLHSLLLEKTLGISHQQVIDQQHLRYLRGADEAFRAVKNDAEVNVAFLMNPVSMEQMREIAFAGEVLPQKSTDFYPKLLSGLTIYSLDNGC